MKTMLLGASVAVLLLISGSAQARPMICPMIYKPVCAVKHGAWRTYGNACQARAAHAHIRYQGRCRVHRASEGY